MTKKHFIALADAIRIHNAHNDSEAPFTDTQLAVLAGFCKSQNRNFMADRWLGYIAGTNGRNGGKVKVAA